jgi:hypothetical protein
LAYFYRHRLVVRALLRFPSPIRSKTRTVPTDDGFRSGDCKGTIYLGKQSADASQYQPSTETNRNLLGLARPSTLICCRSTRISTSSATRDRNRWLAIQKINRHKSCIGNQHRAILNQLPARLNLRQGQALRSAARKLWHVKKELVNPFLIELPGNANHLVRKGQNDP